MKDSKTEELKYIERNAKGLILYIKNFIDENQLLLESDLESVGKLFNLFPTVLNDLFKQIEKRRKVENVEP